MHHPQINYLALGDSYTIGETVALRETYPYQTVALLRETGIEIAAPEIVATTGWTTDELAAAITNHRFLPQYGLVTLLIGVNNQYRGGSLENYKNEFRDLLQTALKFAANKKDRVVVLSIPDYGVTPFGKDYNPEKIGRELDAFNAAAKDICNDYGVVFIDITTGSKDALHHPELVATDGLHPSGKEYRKWAEKLAASVMDHLK
jgi:lysophospholipase L1-like esterase